MRKFNMIAGLPRSGSTLLCNLLNQNPIFHATPTSGVIDVLRNMRSTFSHNVTWKTQDRLSLIPSFRKGMKGFLDGFYEDKEVVFDKCRGWSNNINLLDAILGDNDSKIIWTYRDPVEVVSSIEARYQATVLLENVDEAQAAGAFATLDRRVGAFINNGGIVAFPVEVLRDAIEMGYENRILFVTYHDITNNTQEVMDKIHDFIGEERIDYDLDNVKQTTQEFDGLYNYKFMHTIREGKIEYKKADIKLPFKYRDIINGQFRPLNKYIFEGNPDELLGIQFPEQIETPPEQNIEQPENPDLIQDEEGTLDIFKI